MNRKKTICNIIFLIAIFTFTFYSLLKDQDLKELIALTETVNIKYILLSFIFVLLFICSESVIIYYMMWILKYKVPIFSCIKYSFIGFFFSCITPSASGGQPAQMYYMNKDNVNIATSSLVLLIVTIAYKFVLVFIGVLLIIFQYSFMINHIGRACIFLYLGLLLNIICVIAMLVFVFSSTFANKIMCGGLRFLEKIKILKYKRQRHERLNHALEQYHKAANVFKNHKMVMFNVFLITLFQRCSLFFITYLVYYGFGFREYNIWQIVTLQAVIAISVDMLPLPGGMGASENLFIQIFKPIFGSTVMSGMLLSRGINYYAVLIISAIVTVYAHLTLGKKQKKY